MYIFSVFPSFLWRSVEQLTQGMYIFSVFPSFLQRNVEQLTQGVYIFSVLPKVSKGLWGGQGRPGTARGGQARPGTVLRKPLPPQTPPWYHRYQRNHCPSGINNTRRFPQWGHWGRRIFKLQKQLHRCIRTLNSSVL